MQGQYNKATTRTRELLHTQPLSGGASMVGNCASCTLSGRADGAQAYAKKSEAFATVRESMLLTCCLERVPKYVRAPP